MGFNNILGLINTIQGVNKITPKQNTDLFSNANTSQGVGLPDTANTSKDADLFQNIVTTGVDKLKESPLGKRLTNAGFGTEPIETVGKNLLIETIFKEDETGAKPLPKHQGEVPKVHGEVPVTTVAPPLQPQEQIPQVAPIKPPNRVAQLFEQQRQLAQKLRGI